MFLLNVIFSQKYLHYFRLSLKNLIDLITSFVSGSGVNLRFCLSLFTTTAKLVFSFKLMHFHRLCGWPVSHWQELFILTPGFKPANIYPPPLRFDSWNLTLLVRMIGNFPSLCLTLTLRGTWNYVQSSWGGGEAAKLPTWLNFIFSNHKGFFNATEEWWHVSWRIQIQNLNPLEDFSTLLFRFSLLWHRYSSNHYSCSVWLNTLLEKIYSTWTKVAWQHFILFNFCVKFWGAFVWFF